MSWYENWFDSKYYHILYKSRDYEEASRFISNLNAYFEFNVEDHVLDLACGKGRHSIQLSKFNCKVTGIDLSPASIKIANESSNDRLWFRVGDMREDLGGPYTHVLNLFTSFGYFNNTDENIRVFESVEKALKSNGIFVIDFFNATCVEALISDPIQKDIEGIRFNISKRVENGIIHKNISFVDDGQEYNFEEQVQLLRLDDFRNFAKLTGFEIENVWGDYDLKDFKETSSERLIMQFRLR